VNEVRITGEFYWFPKLLALYGFFAINYAIPSTKDDLVSLVDKPGDFRNILMRLRRYFAVSVGSEHRLVGFPINYVPPEFPEGNRTVIQLHFLLRQTDHEGIPTCLRGPAQ
jgi:hypothetical protein